VGLINVEVTVNLSRSFPLDPHTFLRDPMIFPECSEGDKVLDNFTYGAASNRLRKTSIGLSSTYWAQDLILLVGTWSIPLEGPISFKANTTLLNLCFNNLFI